MPALNPSALMPAPAPTAPCSTASPPTDERAAAQAARTSSTVTRIVRGSDRKLSSHSATTGTTTSSTPTAGFSSTSSWHAASYTRPTCMVDVRKTGVSSVPHSRRAMKPVHSPQPLRIAPPAVAGRPNRSSATCRTVTPVRATPGPPGGGGSSAQIVVCPSPTPATSSTELVRPRGSWPILIPKSAMRTSPACRDREGKAMSLELPIVMDPACRLHDPAAEIWLGVRTPGTEVAERYDVIRAAVLAAGAREVIAQTCDDGLVQAVHSDGLLAHLATIYDDWVA